MCVCVCVRVCVCVCVVGDGLVQPEALNKKAIQIINRVRDKLTGETFTTRPSPPSPDHYHKNCDSILRFIAIFVYFFFHYTMEKG